MTAPQFSIPVLFGHIDLNLINPFSLTEKDGFQVMTLNVNGRERHNGEFNFPLYQDEYKLVGEVHTKNLGVIDDAITVLLHIQPSEIDKKYIGSNKLLEIVASVSKGTVFQTNKLKTDSITKPIGVASYIYSESFIREQEQRETAEFIDNSLPFSRYD